MAAVFYFNPEKPVERVFNPENPVKKLWNGPWRTLIGVGLWLCGGFQGGVGTKFPHDRLLFWPRVQGWPGLHGLLAASREGLGINSQIACSFRFFWPRVQGRRAFLAWCSWAVGLRGLLGLFAGVREEDRFSVLFLKRVLWGVFAPLLEEGFGCSWGCRE